MWIYPEYTNNNIYMRANKKFSKIDKYQIDYTHLLGKGGMASVYLGYYAEEEGDPESRFAVKEISINSSFAITDSLLQEINLLRKFNHPYILKYIDAKKSGTALYLILELCDGGTLEDEVLSYQDLPQDLLRKYLAQIVIALKYMKDEKIIHRDIKPKNILIHKGSIKISDFGVAKLINEHNEEKETVTFSGTVQFMSPQILKQDKYTFQTDIWSLGVTIYWMVFKKLPWTSTKVLGILKEIEQKDGIQIPQYGINPQLRDFLQQTLIQKESDRATVQQLFTHPYIKQYVEEELKEIESYETYVPGEITKDQFMISSQEMKNQDEKKLQRRSVQVFQTFRASQLTQDRARSAYQKLHNIKEQILFFKETLEDLRFYHRKKSTPLFSDDLFKKCEFLLVKRAYIQAKDLHQIFVFGTHTQGNIMIPKDEFIQFMDEKKVHYNRLIRDEVGLLYDQFKNEWLNTKEEFYEHQRRYGIKIIPRQDAYLENLVENKNLILAFNDCFLELFFTLSAGIIEAYAHKLSQQISTSNIVLNHGVRISFVYDLMVILCFARLTDNANMKTYKEKKKYVSCQEFIYRIQIATKFWRSDFEHLLKLYQ